MRRKNSIAGLAVAAAAVGVSMLMANQLQEREEETSFLEQNRDEHSQVYLFGSGMGSLSLAHFLIHHANLPGKNITIFESAYHPWQSAHHNRLCFHRLETLSPKELLNAKEVFYQIYSDDVSVSENLDRHFATFDPVTPLCLRRNGTLDKLSLLNVGSLSKSPLRQVLFSRDSSFLSQSVEEFFSDTGFLDSDLFTYLVGRYDLTRHTSLRQLQESLFHLIMHMKEDSSDEFYFLSQSLEEFLYQPFVAHLKEQGVHFLSHHHLVHVKHTEDAVTKLVLEHQQTVEEIPVTKQDIVLWEEEYTHVFYEGGFTCPPTKLHRQQHFHSDDIHYDLSALTGDVSCGIEWITLTMKDDTFRQKLEQLFSRTMDNREIFFAAGKGNLLLQIPPRNFVPEKDVFLLKIAHPHQHGIFIPKEYRHCTGEEIVYELIKLLHLEEDFGVLRESMEEITLCYYPNYHHLIETIPYFTSSQNFALLSDRFDDPYMGYSLEKQVFRGMKIAHDMMGIDHIEPAMEELPAPTQLFSFLHSLKEE